jgi:hypothetical protein
MQAATRREKKKASSQGGGQGKTFTNFPDSTLKLFKNQSFLN